MFFNESLTSSMARRIPKAALEAGVPADSVSAFIAVIETNDPNVASIPGVTSAMVQAGALASQYATADALEVVFAIGTPFGIIAAIMCYWLGSYKDTLNYVVEAPVEELHAKNRGEKHLQG